MTYREKLTWLRKIFSNDLRIRAEAMSAEIPQPLFDSLEDFTRALKELEYDRRTKGYILNSMNGGEEKKAT